MAHRDIEHPALQTLVAVAYPLKRKPSRRPCKIGNKTTSNQKNNLHYHSCSSFNQFKLEGFLHQRNRCVHLPVEVYSMS